MKGKYFYLLVIIILLNLAKLEHPIILIYFVIYLIFLLIKLKGKQLLFFLLISCVFLVLPHKKPVLNNVIEGQIIEVKDRYFLLQTVNQLIQIFHYDEVELFDHVKVSLKDIREIWHPQNIGLNNQIKTSYAKRLYYQAKVNKIEIVNQFNLRKFVLKTLKNSRIDHYISDLIFNYKQYDLLDDFNMEMIRFLLISSSLRMQCFKFLINYLFGRLHPKIRRTSVFFLLLVYAYILKFDIASIKAIGLYWHKENSRYLNRVDLLSIIAMLMIMMNPFIIYSLAFQFNFFFSFLYLLTNSVDMVKWRLMIMSPVVLMIQKSASIVHMLFLDRYRFLVKGLFYCLWFAYLIPLSKPMILIIIDLFQYFNLIIGNLKFILPYFKIETVHIITYYIILYLMFKYYHIFKKRKRYILLLISLVGYFFISPFLKLPYEIIFFDVGQGDAILVIQPFLKHVILIDTGLEYYTKTVILPYLHYRGIRTIDTLFITHPDQDHNGGISFLSEHVKINQFIHSLINPIQIGQIIFQNLNPKDEVNTNADSLVLYFKIHNLHCLMMGDATSTEEINILLNYPDIIVDVLKVGHHGSKTSSNNRFLYHYHPKYAIISAGYYNPYNHPHSDVVERYRYLNIDLLDTPTHGMVWIKQYQFDEFVYTARRKKGII